MSRSPTQGHGFAQDFHGLIVPASLLQDPGENNKGLNVPWVMRENVSTNISRRDQLAGLLKPFGRGETIIDVCGIFGR